MKKDTTDKKPNQDSHNPSYSTGPTITCYPITLPDGWTPLVPVYTPTPSAILTPKIPAEECSKPKGRNTGRERLNESDGQYMDTDGLASYIKRSKGAIRNLVLRKDIPHRKQAGRLIFLKDEIDQWIKMAPGKSLDEIENDI
jgi:hypothetical protein